LSVKKRSHVGTVISTKMQNSCTVEWERRYYLPKYERHTKRRTRVHAHVPEGVEVNEGDKVRIYASRPISKTINFVVMENLGKEKHYAAKKEAKEEAEAVHEAKHEKEAEEAKSEEE